MAARSRLSAASRWRRSSATCSGTSRSWPASSASSSSRSRRRTSTSCALEWSAGSSPAAATSADGRGGADGRGRGAPLRRDRPRPAVDREALEALGQARRHERAHAHAVGRVLASHFAGELVQLGEAAAVGVRHEQLDAAQRVLELVDDPLAELLEALAGDAADEHGVGMAQAQLLALVLAEQVDLVQHEQPWPLAGADLLERLLDGVTHLIGVLLRR